jgi:stringent starvation protein B
MNSPHPSSSTRPYLLRALYEWCADNGFTPFIAVAVDASVTVPQEFVRDGEIVLNISMDATSGLLIGNDAIEFKGRFGGVARDIYVPVHRVLAIYARESGQGMAFPLDNGPDLELAEVQGASSPAPARPMAPKLAPIQDARPTPSETSADGPTPPKPPSGTRPTLTRIK